MLEYQRQNKVAYLNYCSIAAREHRRVHMLLRLPPYLTFKSEENVSQINDSESLNFESLNIIPQIIMN